MTDCPRATRYDVAADLLFRPAGAEAWCPGRTVNMSRTGVLFRPAQSRPEVAARIQFLLLLPGLGLPGRSRVLCTGRVVRHVDDERRGEAVAATIDAYEFLGMGPAAIPGMVRA
jgi:hypothetical protein